MNDPLHKSPRFGRLPRKFDDKIPKLSTVRRKLVAPPQIPTAVNYDLVLPPWTGMFGNDWLGDCTCAAVYHAYQVWSANANPPIDEDPESRAVQLYQECCGYVPGDASTDNGGVEQDVLNYWLNVGVPRGSVSDERSHLTAFVEIDQRSLENVKAAIFEGGLAYIGFEVPAYFNFAKVWDIDPAGDPTIISGHAVILTGYDDSTQRFRLLSWGEEYFMSYNFFLKFTDEAYFLLDAEWINNAARTSPMGLDMAALEEAMTALRWHWAENQRYRHKKHLKKRRRLANAAAQPSENS